MYQSFSKRQLLAMTWWNRPGLGQMEGIICDGAIRSGKTVSMVTGFFLWSMTKFDGCCFALCGRTVGALRRNIISNLEAWLGDALQIRENRSENKLVVSDGSGRHNTYYLFGGQDESAYKLIQGITLAGVLLDEADIPIDCKVPYGDAVIDVGDAKMGGLSTYASLFIVNTVLIEGAKRALARGTEPPVYTSGNVEGGRAHNIVLENLYLGRVKHL